ncbi:MAG: hypothetical protein OXR07_07030 [Nitrospira sp.]|nr:hypothetical protein [Nitrospira sp.]MDD9860617.1 hypothetical protein [Nitrospira sp.]
MGKELSVISLTQSDGAGNEFIYSRVFCQRKNPPPLRLLLDFLKSRNQIPLIPQMTPETLDDYSWAQIALGYHREKKPIQLFCIRNAGTYQDVFEQEQAGFSRLLSAFGDVEADLAKEFVVRATFILVTRILKKDVSEEGYDFNGWILEFFQENCTGVVQIDEQGFFSPQGELIVDMQDHSTQQDLSRPEIPS